MRRFYFDNNANMPVRPEVNEYLDAREFLGNPASVHEEGRRSRGLLDEARRAVADWAGVDPAGVVFTSGGTEANALAVHMLTRRAQVESRPAVAGIHAGAHAALSDNVEAVVGWEIERFQPLVSGEPVEAAFRKRASVYYEMAAHNETGEIYDLRPSIDAARKNGGWIHVDAVQVPGKMGFPEVLREADSFAISGHKFGGPMGAGALVLPEPFEFEPLIRGGGQEFGRRSGTPSLYAIAGMGAAIGLDYDRETSRALALRLRDGLRRDFEGWLVELSDCEQGLPGTLLLAFPDVPGDLFAAALDREGIAVSYGSACSSGEQEPSRALLEMEVPYPIARSAIRFSFAPQNSAEEVDEAAPRILRAFEQVKSALSHSPNGKAS